MGGDGANGAGSAHGHQGSGDNKGLKEIIIIFDYLLKLYFSFFLQEEGEDKKEKYIFLTKYLFRIRTKKLRSNIYHKSLYLFIVIVYF